MSSVVEPESKMQKLEGKEGEGSKLIVSGAKTNCILVNPRQRGNPLLKAIVSVPWEFEESLVPDYVMGRTTCALFLSLRYHNLKPDYINQRLKDLGKLYDLRVLLVQVDMKDPNHSLKHITRVCLLTDMTLMLAWSPEEAGKILEMYKVYEHKPPDLIMERSETDPHVKLVGALTSIRSVNRTDAVTLLSSYGSLEKMIRAGERSLSQTPGLGGLKASRLHSVLHTPFLRSAQRKPPPPQSAGIAKYFKT